MPELFDKSSQVPPMRADKPLSFRLVVQRVQESGRRPQYRVIAYSDTGNCQPLQFASLEEVRERLRRAAPGLDTTRLRDAAEEPETSIVFAEVLELTPSQLQLLGLQFDRKRS
jgi:hypothetical protein